MEYLPPGTINRWLWLQVTVGFGEPWLGHSMITVALTTVVTLEPTGASTGLLVFTSTITLLSAKIAGPPGPVWWNNK